ncbi:hypothetical protein C5D98_14875 [Rathayibacter rathayi]|uniref:hypothetical protein n=1 Tax=Rathayibacter rathayi TaxID=33887 RepID=UPI000CE84142|nr:hypothetical protein [Rathayibacter rathayi]PPG77465.1 hypothetical protein C5C15_09220 [Rathayibacter rathayi]PPI65233.1 hypothetical protein C5D98_14875 [Rathayibacter rathayi]
MTTYHLADIEIQVDTTHADSPWVDVALSSGEGEAYAPTSLISLSSTEARALGRDLITEADTADGVDAEADAPAAPPEPEATPSTEFDTIHTSVLLSTDQATNRNRRLAERAEQLDRFGRQGWTLAASASGSDGRSLVIVDTLQRSRA